MKAGSRLFNGFCREVGWGIWGWLGLAAGPELEEAVVWGWALYYLYCFIQPIIEKSK